MKLNVKGNFNVPDKFSDLMNKAFNNLINFSKDPTYCIYMGTFHKFDEDRNVCDICLAGAFLAKSIKLSPFIDYYDFIQLLSNKDYVYVHRIINSIDAFRRGKIIRSYSLFTNTNRLSLKKYNILIETPMNWDNFSNFYAWEKEYKKNFKETIKYLKSHNL